MTIIIVATQQSLTSSSARGLNMVDVVVALLSLDHTYLMILWGERNGPNVWLPRDSVLYSRSKWLKGLRNKMMALLK